MLTRGFCFVYFQLSSFVMKRKIWGCPYLLRIFEYGLTECVICPLTRLARLHPCGQVCRGLTSRCRASSHTKESGTRVIGNGHGQMVPVHWGRRTQTDWSRFNFGVCILQHYLILDYMHHLSQLWLDKSLMRKHSGSMLNIQTLPSPV